MKKTATKFFYRFPRIAAIVFIVFLSMFALDIFGNGYSFRETVVGLFMHLIPTWILIIVLLLSWKKYPLVGAIVFMLFALGYTTLTVTQFFRSVGTQPTPYYLLTRPLIIALPAFFVAIGFFVNRRQARKENKKNDA